jgi:hypothetical protein
VYQVGLKIIETIVDLKKRYPDTSATLLAGGVLTLLASWIPVLGGALAPIIAGVTIGLATVAFIVEFVKKQFKSLRDALAR